MKISSEAQDVVNRVRELLDTVVFSHCPKQQQNQYGEWVTCQFCDGTGKSKYKPFSGIEYNGLRKLVEDDCEGVPLRRHGIICCDGTLKVTRNWMHYFRGSLRGVMEFGDRLPKTWDFCYLFENPYFPDDVTGRGLEVEIDGNYVVFQIVVGDDPDFAIMEALELALMAILKIKV